MTSHLVALLLVMLGPNDFSMSLPLSPETAEGQRLIAERALEICGGRYPHLGRYRFEGSERTQPDGKRSAVFAVEQEMACMDARPPETRPTEEAAPADWEPSLDDERRVQELTRRYFALVDAGDSKRAHEMWSSNTRLTTPLDARAAQIDDFRKQAGKPGEHRIAALTWYVNPPGAPTPGIYVAADYERSYEKLALNCGYVVWFRERNGGYVLIREENNMLPRQPQEPSPQSLDETRAMLGCRS